MLPALSSPAGIPSGSKHQGRRWQHLGTTTWLLILAFALLLASTIIPSARADGTPAAETKKIEALISHLESLKDATFIRNGSEYDAKSSAKFLRGKWHAHEKEIATAKDFITKVATVSSTTGKPYVIRFKDGSETPCGDCLSKQLAKLEAAAGSK